MAAAYFSQSQKLRLKTSARHGLLIEQKNLAQICAKILDFIKKLVLF